jgi:uncharacterized OsmC-like protein
LTARTSAAAPTKPTAGALLAPTLEEARMARPENVLGQDPRPRFFAVADAAELGLEAPEPRHDVAVRLWGRSLAGMQKEALVAGSAGERAWRLVSDEGPYLDGYDEAPFPLAFMTTGMAASYMHEITSAATRRGIELRDIRLTLDSFYTMEGSALRGTMKGGALPPELSVSVASDTGDDLDGLVRQAVRASPVDGLLRHTLESRFTLTANADVLEPGRVRALSGAPQPDPAAAFSRVQGAEQDAPEPLVALLVPADQIQGEGGVSSSLAESQSRTLHVRGVCELRRDGLKEIELQLHRPVGSTFRFLSDEAPRFGGSGLAPDAATYLAAGLGFCFMTQLGRYARITKHRLDRYRIVQDMHLSAGRATGVLDPIETHVHLDTPESDDFARTVVDMSEQTCFLHALCRTQLEPKVKITANAVA